MPGFDAIIGQRLPVRLLQQFVLTGAIPHALLFTGISGVGKYTLAKTFAMALNCHRHSSPSINETAESITLPCGTCAACHKIEHERHPDVIFLKPQKASLRIDRIRGLLGTLAMKPFSARHRVVIIDDAHTMTQEAGNALLKVLEEPPSDTILVLITSQKEKLLPTIVSRCRHIQFQPLSAEDLATLLVRHQAVAPDQASIIADMADGSLEKATMLALDKWHAVRNWVACAAGLAPSGSQSPSAFATAMAFAAQMAQHKDQINQFLEILGTWLRDLAIIAYQGAQVVNADCRMELQQVRSGLSEQAILGMWQLVQNAQKDIAANSNLRLTMDLMALDLAACMARPPVGNSWPPTV